MMPALWVIVALLLTGALEADTGNGGSAELRVQIEGPTTELQVGERFYLAGSADSPSGAATDGSWGTLTVTGCTVVTDTPTTGPLPIRFVAELEVTNPTCTWTRTATGTAAGPVTIAILQPTGSVSGVQVHEFGSVERGGVAWWAPLLLLGGLFIWCYDRMAQGAPWYLLPALLVVPGFMVLLFPAWLGGKSLEVSLYLVVGCLILFLPIAFFTGLTRRREAKESKNG